MRLLCARYKQWLWPTSSQVCADIHQDQNDTRSRTNRLTRLVVHNGHFTVYEYSLKVIDKKETRQV